MHHSLQKDPLNSHPANVDGNSLDAFGAVTHPKAPLLDDEIEIAFGVIVSPQIVSGFKGADGGSRRFSALARARVAVKLKRFHARRNSVSRVFDASFSFGAAKVNSHYSMRCKVRFVSLVPVVRGRVACPSVYSGLLCSKQHAKDMHQLLQVLGKGGGGPLLCRLLAGSGSRQSQKKKYRIPQGYRNATSPWLPITTPLSDKKVCYCIPGFLGSCPFLCCVVSIFFAVAQPRSMRNVQSVQGPMARWCGCWGAGLS